MGDQLKEKTAQSLMWGGVNNGGMQVLSLLAGIVMLRLLTPADWGLVGMLAIFSAIAGNLQSSGFSTALVNERDPQPEQYNSVFWFNTLCSFAIYLLLCAAAPLIARFFHQPELVWLSRVIFLSFFFSSFGIATNAYMTKHLMMREQAIVALTSLIVSSAVGIAMALAGMAYWSIAVQQVCFALLSAVGRFYYVPWRPRWGFSLAFIRQSFGFSMKILVTTIVNSINQNLLTIVLGRLFRSPRVVGNFFQAYKWDQMAFQTVSGMLAQVAQPVIVTVKDDGDRERRVFRKMLRFTALLSFPVLFGLSMVSEEFIVVTIGTKWIDCVPLLAILAVGGAFMPFYTLYQQLVISHGRSDLNMWLGILQVAGQLGAVYASHRYGITAMVVAFTAFTVGWLGVWVVCGRAVLRVRLRDAAADMLPFLAVAAAALTAAYFLTRPIAGLALGPRLTAPDGTQLPSYLTLLLLLVARIVAAATLYYGMLRLLHVQILSECMQFAKQKFSNLERKSSENNPS